MQFNQNSKKKSHRTTQSTKSRTQNRAKPQINLQRVIQRVSANPSGATPQEILTLQQTVGNRAVQRMLNGSSGNRQNSQSVHQTRNSSTPTFQVQQRSPKSVQRVIVSDMGNYSSLLKNDQTIGNGEAVIAAARVSNRTDFNDHAYVFMEMVSGGRPMNIRIDLGLDRKKNKSWKKSGAPTVNIGRLTDEGLKDTISDLDVYARKVPKMQAVKAYQRANELRSLMGGELIRKTGKKTIKSALKGARAKFYKYVKLGRQVVMPTGNTTIYNCTTLAQDILAVAGVANKNTSKTDIKYAGMTFTGYSPRQLVKGMRSQHEQEIEEEKKKQQQSEETTTTSSAPELTTQTQPTYPEIVMQLFNLLDGTFDGVEDFDGDYPLGGLVAAGISQGTVTKDALLEFKGEHIRPLRAKYPETFHIMNTRTFLTDFREVENNLPQKTGLSFTDLQGINSTLLMNS